MLWPIPADHLMRVGNVLLLAVIRAKPPACLERSRGDGKVAGLFCRRGNKKVPPRRASRSGRDDGQKTATALPEIPEIPEIEVTHPTLGRRKTDPRPGACSRRGPRRCRLRRHRPGALVVEHLAD